MLAYNSHAKIGKIWYEKTFWSGKTSIMVDGIELTQLSSTLFTYEKEGVKYTVIVKGNSFTGISLNFSSNQQGSVPIIIPMVEGIKMYQYVLSVISFVILALWLNPTKDNTIGTCLLICLGVAFTIYIANATFS